MLVGSTGFLLVTPHRSKSKTFSTFLVVCRRLRNLLLQRQIIRVVIVLNACRGGCAWLNYNWVDVLDVRNLDLLAVLARWAPSPHGLRWIWAITATAAAHKGCVVSKLETFVRLSRANRSFMVGPNLSSGEPFLEFRGSIKGRATALNLLLGLSSWLSLFGLIRRLLRWLRVSHLGSGGLLSITTTISVLNTQGAFRQGFDYFGDLAWDLNVTLLLLLGCVLLTRVVAQTFGLVALSADASLSSSFVVGGDSRSFVASVSVHIDILSADLRLALHLAIVHVMSAAVIIMLIQIRITHLNLLASTKLAFKVLWSDNVWADLFRRLEILQGQQFSLLRALAVGCRVGWNEFDWLIRPTIRH